MWISSNKWKALEKRIANLEREVQNHRNVLIKHLEDYEQENKDFRNILESLKKEVEKEIMLAGHASKNIKPVSVCNYNNPCMYNTIRDVITPAIPPATALNKATWKEGNLI